MEGTKPRTANSLGMFDLLKGIGMLTIVFAHTGELYPMGSGSINLLTFFMFAYRESLMAAFYIASGYGFRKRSIGKCIDQQFKTLLKPYIYTGIATTVFHFIIHYSLFGSLHNATYETYKVLGGFALGLPHTATYFGQLFFSCGPMWYLLSLMIAWILLDLILNIFPEQYINWAVLGTMLSIKPILDVNAEGKLAAREAKMVMFCSPHNPCGRAWTEEELAGVVNLCYKYGVPLVCDEIHADFVYAPNAHHSILNLPHADELAVMLCAASKTFNVAGLQQASLVCKNERMREAIAKESTACGVKSGNVFALAATRAAYTDCDAWLDGLKAYLVGNRDCVTAYAKAHFPKVIVTPLEATYLMWLDCRALGLEQEELMRRLLNAHVKVNDGLFFGEGGRGFIRLNIGCPRAQLNAALERMKDVLN